MLEGSQLERSGAAPKAVVVAGVHSGVGKTTVACALMAALVDQGLAVQPFKCGPDFLDGLHHREAVRGSRPPLNLDGWMLGKAACVDSFARHAHGADICVIEGVMGLFDGRDGNSDDGSTAQIAKWLGAPVVLVIDCWAMARTAVAVALGLAQFDPDLNVAAVICNRVAGEAHGAWIAHAFQSEPRLQTLRLLGCLPKAQTVAIPERHLGLQAPREEPSGASQRRTQALAALARAHLELPALLALAATTIHPAPAPAPTPPPRPHRITIAVARDAAFCFLYEENLQLLRHAGAHLAFFSPLTDPALPAGADALLLCGGYPEAHAAALEANAAMRAAVRDFVRRGGPVWAECGGLMFLARTLHPGTPAGRPFAMCAVFDFDVHMTAAPTLDYLQLTICPGHPLFPAGLGLRAHAFHFSEASLPPSPHRYAAPFLAQRQQPGSQFEPEGYTTQRCFASYAHIHLGSAPDLAAAVVERLHALRPPSGSPRAVSFSAAATEVAVALGAGAALVGVSSLAALPMEDAGGTGKVVARPTVDAERMSSKEVTEAMAQLQAGEGRMWNMDTAALADLQPQVAFVQESCDKCEPRSSEAIAALQAACLTVHVEADAGGLGASQAHASNGDAPAGSPVCRCTPVSPRTLSEAFACVRAVGRALRLPHSGASLAAGLERRLEHLRSLLGALDDGRSRARVLSLEGLCPPCLGGGWLTDVKQRAGLEDAAGVPPGAPARVVSWAEIEAADPDALLLCPCSAPVSRTLRELQLVTEEAAFWRLRAVQQRRVWLLDDLLFSVPGPRLVAGAELLAALLHGQLDGHGEGARDGGGTAQALTRQQLHALGVAAERWGVGRSQARGSTESGQARVPLAMRLRAGPVPLRQCAASELAAEFQPAFSLPPGTQEATRGGVATADIEDAVPTEQNIGGAGARPGRAPLLRRPVTVDDLDTEVLEAARQAGHPHALAVALHKLAEEKRAPAYVDPETGLRVFSAVALRRRPCCGNACRHCPYEHTNVPPHLRPKRRFGTSAT